MDETNFDKDIWPLGSDSPSPQLLGSPDAAAAACSVCDDLRYKLNPEDVRRWSKLPWISIIEAFFGVHLTESAAVTHFNLNSETGELERYFVGDWKPPDHQPAWHWIQSSKAGCDKCGLVVAALTHHNRGFWADVGPGTKHKLVSAQAVPGMCVMATMTDTRNRDPQLRHEMVEISSMSCKCLLSNAPPP